MTRALVFPGQGSQVVGMGKDFYDAFPSARDVFHEVDDALNEHLSRLIFEGPLDTLTLTRNTQPALMVVSLAILKALIAELGFNPVFRATYIAGHSLGEYTALAAAESIDVATTAQLLRVRGEAMQSAVPQGRGAMAALIGGTMETAEKLVAEAAHDEICVVANDNATDQQVISGESGAIQRAVELASSHGFKRALPLPVSAPFHSPLMAPAAEVMREALADIEWKTLPVPLIANTTAIPTVETTSLTPQLVDQVAGRVRWRESLMVLEEKGIEHLVEIGAGKVLCGLARRTVPALQGMSIGCVADINQFMQLMR